MIEKGYERQLCFRCFLVRPELASSLIAHPWGCNRGRPALLEGRRGAGQVREKGNSIAADSDRVSETPVGIL